MPANDRLFPGAIPDLTMIGSVKTLTSGGQQLCRRPTTTKSTITFSIFTDPRGRGFWWVGKSGKEWEDPEQEGGNEAQPRMPLKVALSPAPEVPAHSATDGIDYELGADYWSKVDPTIDGMLGGFAQISPLDIDGSSKFLKWVLKGSWSGSGPPSTERALDCGAGIGRVTKYLLQRHFHSVDLVEQDAKFLDHSRAYLGPTAKVERRFCSGLQSFTPQSAHYDVIWSQWVLGHLTDPDLVAFFRRCACGLKSNGVLIVKENTTSSDTIEQDPQDGSVTRPDSLLKALFAQADLVLIKDLPQLKFPADLYPVKMYALRPKTALDSPDEAKLKAVGMLPD